MPDDAELLRDQNDLLRRQNQALRTRVDELLSGKPIDPGLRQDLARCLSLLSDTLHACCGATSGGEPMIEQPGFKRVEEEYEQIKARFEALGS